MNGGHWEWTTAEDRCHVIRAPFLRENCTFFWNSSSVGAKSAWSNQELRWLSLNFCCGRADLLLIFDLLLGPGFLRLSNEIRHVHQEPPLKCPGIQILSPQHHELPKERCLVNILVSSCCSLLLMYAFTPCSLWFCKEMLWRVKPV